MRHSMRSVLGLVIGLGVLFAVSGGDEASAQCCAPPPPCCTPPAPPPCCTPPAPPPTPTPPCCSPPGHNVNVPGVNVNVNASVIVNANVNVNAQAGAVAGATSGARSTTVFYGGGGFGGGIAPGPISVIQGLNVQGGREKRRVAYEERREKTMRVVIQAFCLDVRSVPHPASQVFPERDVDGGYDGELYRCLAGTRMQYVVAEYLDRVSFDGGKTVTCDKNQALYHTREGRLECRRQTAARDCNERSLLRRFGAGIKILTIRSVETFTAYREEEFESSSSSSGSLTLSGGVGGVAY